MRVNFLNDFENLLFTHTKAEALNIDSHKGRLQIVAKDVDLEKLLYKNNFYCLLNTLFTHKLRIRQTVNIMFELDIGLFHEEITLSAFQKDVVYEMRTLNAKVEC